MDQAWDIADAAMPAKVVSAVKSAQTRRVLR
jgi:hypothetical protein